MSLTNLDGRIKQLENIKPLLNQIGQDQTRSTLDNFQTGGRPARWAPVSYEALYNSFRSGNSKRKNKRQTMKRTKGGGKTLTAGFSRYVGGKKILIDTGMLYQSIDWKSKSSLVQVGVMGGPALAYAATHQFGNSKKNIPARPFLVLLSQDRTQHNETAMMHWRKT